MQVGSLDPIELAWAAGFYEGEGNFRAPKHQRCGGLRLAIAQVDSESIHRFNNIMGGTCHFYLRKPRQPHHYPCHMATITCFEHVQHAVCLLWRHLSKRRRTQIAAAFTHYFKAFREGRAIPRGRYHRCKS